MESCPRFARRVKMFSSDHSKPTATLHGVVFDILVGGGGSAARLRRAASARQPSFLMRNWCVVFSAGFDEISPSQSIPDDCPSILYPALTGPLVNARQPILIWVPP